MRMKSDRALFSGCGRSLRNFPRSLGPCPTRQSGDEVRWAIDRRNGRRVHEGQRRFRNERRNRSGALHHTGDGVWSRRQGKADTAVSGNTMFDIGPMRNAFTAVAIMQLVERESCRSTKPRMIFSPEAAQNRFGNCCACRRPTRSCRSWWKKFPASPTRPLSRTGSSAPRPEAHFVRKQAEQPGRRENACGRKAQGVPQIGRIDRSHGTGRGLFRKRSSPRNDRQDLFHRARHQHLGCRPCGRILIKSRTSRHPLQTCRRRRRPPGHGIFGAFPD